MRTLVGRAQEHVPRYGTECAAVGDLLKLQLALAIQVDTAVHDMDAPAVFLPSWHGWHRVVVAPPHSEQSQCFATLLAAAHVLDENGASPATLDATVPAHLTFALVGMLAGRRAAPRRSLEARIGLVVPARFYVRMAPHMPLVRDTLLELWRAAAVRASAG